MSFEMCTLLSQGMGAAVAREYVNTWCAYCTALADLNACPACVLGVSYPSW